MQNKNSEVGVRLSKNMEKALKQCTYKWQSAYEMGVNINSLEALKRRGLIEVRYGPGSMAFPRNGIEWKLFELFDTTTEQDSEGI